MSCFLDAARELDAIQTRRITGSVAAVQGLTLFADDLPMPVGSQVRVRPTRRGGPSPRGEIVGFSRGRAVIMLFDGVDGVGPGAIVEGGATRQVVPCGDMLLGRVINAMGEPIDGGPPLYDVVSRPIGAPPAGALDRRRIDQPLPTGVRVIDGMLTLGRGQRIGVFAGPGVGKSTLLASIARNTAADCNVIALVGERGREVGEFLDDTLGPEGLARSVVVVATGDESPLLRVRAALAAATVAEHFRDQGRDVMLLMDSITRFAQAQRQIGLASGEQPATKGYTPSVFARLPVLLERAGALRDGGSITGVYTVLVEGDDLTEPVSDAARGVLDGHIALSRRIAGQGRYPAVDLLESISRVADAVCDDAHCAARQRLIRALAAFREAEELINIGAYSPGANPDCDAVLALRDQIDAFLTQGRDDSAAYPETCRALLQLAAQINETSHQAARSAAAARAAG